MEAEIFGERRRHHAFADIGLDQDVRLAVVCGAAQHRPDMKRRVRPGRLDKIFDDAGNVVVAFDQENIARPQRLP
jgi:hypothetical protein